MLRLRYIARCQPHQHCQPPTTNMKVFVIWVSLLVLLAVAEEAPAPPPGWHPSGRLLLLPARQEYGPPPTTQPNTTELPQESQSGESQSERLLDSGEYYVLLPDGRLQMVRYTTTVLREESNEQPSRGQYSSNFQEVQYPNFQQDASQRQQQKSFQSSQYRNPFPAGSSNFQQQAQYSKSQQGKQAEAPTAQYQVEYVQFPLPGSQFTQTKLQYAEVKPQESQLAQAREDDQEEESDVSGFEAKVQYRNIKPISAPIYAHNPTPLVRILKK